MKRLLLVLISAICLASLQNGQAQFATHSFALGNLVEAADLATDKWGNVISAGSFNHSGNTFSVLSKYAPDGTLLWTADAVTGPGVLHGGEVETDSAGNIFVAGELRPSQLSPAQLVGGPVFTGPTNRLFLAKYTAAGTLVWAQLFDVPYGYNQTHMACTPNGDVVITGRSYLATTIGSGFPVAQSTSFICRVSGTGNVLWAKQFVNPPCAGGHCGVTGISTDQYDQIYLAGFYNLHVTIDSATLIGSNAAYVAKLSANGNLIWLKGNTDQQNNNHTKPTSIAVTPNGNVFVTGEYYGALVLDGISLPNTLTTKGFLVSYSSSGTVQWAKVLGGVGSDHSVMPEAITTGHQGTVYLAGRLHGNASIGPLYYATPASDYDVFLATADSAGNIIRAIAGGSPGNPDRVLAISSGLNQSCYIQFGSYNHIPDLHFSFGGLTVPSADGYLYKLNAGNQFNTLSGTVFIDADFNGVKDSTDAAAQHIIVQSNNSLLSSGPTGRYFVMTDTGSYFVSLPNPPLYHNLVPASHSISFPAYQLSDSSLHFALQPIPNQQDLRVSLTSAQPPRPGFTYPLHVAYKNIGTTVLTGTIELLLDSLLQFQSSNPVPAWVSGNTLHWNFSNIQPGQQAAIAIQALVPAATPLGTFLFPAMLGLPLAGDLTPQDNSDALKDEVIGSFDPNDKQVSQNHLTPVEVSEGKYLEYIIRFQNTGTDTAFTVRLLDTLDAQLNISTFEMLASSHNYTWSIRGNGILEWRFDNILLPDSNTNEAASHGFVKYRIRPNTNLGLGSIIQNTAAIYFDFNAPVITNTTTTEIALFSGVTDALTTKLQVYPNPNKGEFMVQLQNVHAQNVQAELRNVLGQIIWQKKLIPENGNVQQQIKSPNLSKGIYYLQATTGNGNTVQKLVVE